MRVQLNIRSDKAALIFKVWADFPTIPHEGDIIDVSYFLTEDQINQMYDNDIGFCELGDIGHNCWKKDENGVYPSISVSCND